MKLSYNMRATKYILWKWLLFFGIVFWIALCATDEIYNSYLPDYILESHIKQNLDDVLKDFVPEIEHKEEEVKTEVEFDQVKILWNAVSVILIVILVCCVKLRYGVCWRYWKRKGKKADTKLNACEEKPQYQNEQNVIQNLTEDEQVLKDLALVNSLEESFEESSDISESTNRKPPSSPTGSRPISRSMRVPSIDVKYLQEKLEKVEQTISAMRKRRPGIVSGTKQFQQFLTVLTPRNDINYTTSGEVSISEDC